MERKDYADKFRDIKNEILKEIRELVPRDSAHHFSENFFFVVVRRILCVNHIGKFSWNYFLA